MGWNLSRRTDFEKKKNCYQLTDESIDRPKGNVGMEDSLPKRTVESTTKRPVDEVLKMPEFLDDFRFPPIEVFNPAPGLIRYR